MLQHLRFTGLMAIVLLLSACGGHGGGQSDLSPSVVPQTLTVKMAAGDIATQQASLSGETAGASQPFPGPIQNASAVPAVSLVNCPPGGWCVIQGQTLKVAGFYWYPLNGKPVPNRLITTHFSSTQGVRYTFNPNPVHLTPATYTATIITSLSAPIGLQTITISRKK